MKSTSLWAGVAALGLLTLGAGNLKASVLLEVELKLTGQVQGPTSNKGDSQKFSIDTIKVNTKDILQILDNYTATEFPSSAVLVLVDFDHFAVYSKDPNKENGTLVQNIGTNLMSFSASTQVIQENRNSGNGSYNGTRYSFISIHLNNGAGTTLDISGYAGGKYSGNTQSGKYSHNIKLENGAGTGTNPTDGFMLVTGQIELKGSGTD